jgi:DNA-binding response OmpR family regulator
MLNRARVLIAEDEPVTAMDMACAVEDADGEVLGPVSHVSEGLKLIQREHIHAAILDVMLLDGEITPVAQALVAKEAVVIFHTASDIPLAISGYVGMCKKPTHARRVVQVLGGHLGRRYSHMA